MLNSSDRTAKNLRVSSQPPWLRGSLSWQSSTPLTDAGFSKLQAEADRPPHALTRQASQARTPCQTPTEPHVLAEEGQAPPESRPQLLASVQADQADSAAARPTASWLRLRVRGRTSPSTEYVEQGVSLCFLTVLCMHRGPFALYAVMDHTSIFSLTILIIVMFCSWCCCDGRILNSVTFIYPCNTRFVHALFTVLRMKHLPHCCASPGLQETGLASKRASPQQPSVSSKIPTASSQQPTTAPVPEATSSHDPPPHSPASRVSVLEHPPSQPQVRMKRDFEGSVIFLVRVISR